MIELFDIGEHDSLISVYKEEYINDLVMYKEASTNLLMPLNPLHNKGVRRQDHGGVFIRNGSIYLTKVSYIKEKKLIVSDSPLFVEMKKNESINIDTYEDLEVLRRMTDYSGSQNLG